MNAYEECEFMLTRYIDLYQNYKKLLKYNFNFDLYVLHEKATKEEMAEYYESVEIFAAKYVFGTIYPVEKVLDYTGALELQMQMILNHIKTK